MFRHHIQTLTDWFAQTSRKPLILRGARQVGKSTLVRQFAAERGLRLHEINFETTRMESLGALDHFELDLTLAEIEAKTRTPIDPASSLIFFDEIQANPVALAALRYFHEAERGLAVIAAGSLLEFLIGTEQFSMPVGRVEFVHLGPMTFLEFLCAMDEHTLVEQLTTLETKYWHLHHAHLRQRLREYFFVGGMPEAVATYAATRGVLEVSRVHASILQTYKADFGKYKTRIGFDELGRIFDKLPGVLGRKVKYASLLPDEKARTLYKVIDLFVKAKILLKCVHTNATSLPLSAGADTEVYKLYFLDVGLLHHAMSLSADDVLFRDTGLTLMSEGLSAENFAAQHIAYAGRFFDEPHLYYWLKDKDPTKAEVDFLITRDARVIPIEVKAGKSGALKSLRHFMELHPKSKTALRLDLGDRHVWAERGTFDLLNLPLFLAEQVYRIPLTGTSNAPPSGD